MKRVSTPFWRHKALNQLTRAEWESLCSGCGRCCVLKIEDPETLEVEYTNIACRCLDLKTCRCACYRSRKKKMPDCLDLFRCKPEVFTWLPESCAYRLLTEGYDLPSWHPLLSGDPDSTRKAGMSVRGHMIAENDAQWAPDTVNPRPEGKPGKRRPQGGSPAKTHPGNTRSKR